MLNTVLVVDDDERTLKALARSLGHHATVFTAGAGRDAATIARREHPDVAIVDLRLGKESGVDLIRTLKAEHPGMTVAVMSGYLSTEATVAAVKAGASIVLPKPCTGRDILARIDRGDPENPLGDTPTLAQAESDHIARVMYDTDNNISEAARRLGIFRSSLQRRLKKRRVV